MARKLTQGLDHKKSTFISRRSILEAAIGLSSVVTLGLICRGHFEQASDDGSYRLSQLLDPDNKATAVVPHLLGTVIKVRGVPSPAGTKGVLYTLTEFSAGLCPGCGFFHDSGRSLAVMGPSGTNKPSYFQSQLLLGTLEFGKGGELQMVL